MRHLILAATTALLLSPSLVSGQTRRESDALVLARVCAHEAGWDALADCSAIYDVLRGGAERHGMTMRAFAHAYSGRALRGQTSRPWMAALREDGAEPAGWPRTRYVVQRDGSARASAHPPWSGYRGQWLALLNHARALISGRVHSACEEPPHDWGGDMDHARAERIGLIPVSCGDTRNTFYQRPSLVADRD